jgi:hypothetical protein
VAKPTCIVDGCEAKVHARGMCNPHYWRARPVGGYLKKKKTVEERFWEKIDKSAPNGCWLWTAADNGHGYGNFYVRRGQFEYAHRYSYRLATGDSPETVDHICHNRGCVNPEHLRAATHKQNNEHRQAAQSNSKSGIRGVRLHRWGGWERWEARARHHGRDYSAGFFDTIEEAESAAVALRNELFTHNDLDRGESVA